MKNIIFIFYLCILSILTNAQSISPSVINSSGNVVLINNEIYQWSVGETYINVDIASNIIVTNGFVQPDQIFITKIENNIKPNELSIFPNPIDNFLTVNTNFTQSGNLAYFIYQVDGKLLQSNLKNISNNTQFLIGFEHISAGNYIIEFVFEDDSKQKSQASYKILKKK